MELNQFQQGYFPKNLYHKTKFIKFTNKRFNDTIMKIGYARVSTK